MLELTDLAYKRDALVDGLSRGMKQRLSIARVLLHDPKLLLLDEPAGNLDPRARIEMRELLKTLRGMGKTIMISSHILPELQDLCNTVGIIERGELIYSGPWTDIVKKAKTGTVLHVAVAEQPGAGRRDAGAGRRTSNRCKPNNGFLEVSLKAGIEDYSFVPQRLIQAGFRLDDAARRRSESGNSVHATDERNGAVSRFVATRSESRLFQLRSLDRSARISTA